ncbi:DUF3006 domain-containing protein [Clostridium sp. MSJ-11]|uniref:DUF3006 domain-containing protein n=1 Tax=Clostridium mobile TaxID=2841512 RepID=A0ABS6EMV4_9CLOT|nr:DUF3006 domain-containing protein [Clostridium mobile]MBU5486373.1 DUF3006 domain-containing protein [Clostridium mobile]
MKGVIDRIEEDYAVVELEEGTMVNLSINIIPPEAKEGDVIIIDNDNNITIDEVETENRRKLIEELTKDLWDE